MRDVVGAYADGGRLVSHHLEFDCGIIDNELQNAGLGHLREVWGGIAKQGFCTMDPDVGEWVQKSFGRDGDARTMMSLRTAALLLLPKTETTQRLLEKSHTAGADAQLHRLLFIEMCKRMRS